MLLFLKNNTMVPEKATKTTKTTLVEKRRFSHLDEFLQKLRNIKEEYPLRGDFFFWKKFTYHFFWIFNDLAEFCFKIDILGSENEFLGIFGSKNTKKSIFSTMLPLIHRYQNFMEKHFRTSQVSISDHI